MEDTLQKILYRLAGIENGNIRIEEKLNNICIEQEKLKKENEILRMENQKMKNIVSEQEKRIEQIEREIRKRKIVVQGVEEMEGEDEIQLRNKVRKIIEGIEVNIDGEGDITEIRRMGNPGKGRYRPIVMELKTWEIKDRIMKDKNKLRGTRVYMDDEYSKEVQEQRRKLLKIIKEEKHNGNKARLTYNKAIINGEIFNLEQLETIRQENAKQEVESLKENARRHSERTPEQDQGEKRTKWNDIRSVTSTRRDTKNW